LKSRHTVIKARDLVKRFFLPFAFSLTPSSFTTFPCSPGPVPRFAPFPRFPLSRSSVFTLFDLSLKKLAPGRLAL
jgi:hypothetical protein